MSGDLISREAAMALARNDINRTIDCNDIARLPAVDAEPVRHGEWVESKGAMRCSECASTPLYDYHGRIVMSKACPNCGAKMDKEEK